MTSLRLAAILLASLSPIAIAVPVQAAPAQTQNADARLKQLFTDSDEATLKRNPNNALFRGDLLYADWLGDYIIAAYFVAERKAADQDLTHITAII